MGYQPFTSNFFPSHCSRVTPPLAPVKTSSSSSIQYSRPLSSPPPFVLLSHSSFPTPTQPVLKPITTPAPSIHPMITRSKSKQLATSSPYALVS